MDDPVFALPELKLVEDLLALVDEPWWATWVSHLAETQRILEARPEERAGLVLAALSVKVRPSLHGRSLEIGWPKKRRAALGAVIERVAGPSARFVFTPEQVELLARILERSDPWDVNADPGYDSAPSFQHERWIPALERAFAASPPDEATADALRRIARRLEARRLPTDAVRRLIR